MEQDDLGMPRALFELVKVLSIYLRAHGNYTDIVISVYISNTFCISAPAYQAVD